MFLLRSSRLCFLSCALLLPLPDSSLVPTERNLTAAAAAAAAMSDAPGRAGNAARPGMPQPHPPPVVFTAPDGSPPPHPLLPLPASLGTMPPAPAPAPILAASSGAGATRTTVSARQIRTRASTRSGTVRTVVTSPTAAAGSPALEGTSMDQPSAAASPQLGSAASRASGATFSSMQQAAMASSLSLERPRFHCLPRDASPARPFARLRPGPQRSHFSGSLPAGGGM